MFRFRRLASIALEDFGLRRRPARPETDAEEPVAALDEAPPALVLVGAPELPPGVVWHGSARRSPELQRFVDHLEATRSG